MTRTEMHLQQARLQATRLLQRAEPPVVITDRSLLLGGSVIFLCGLVAGFAWRVWELGATP